MAYNFAEKRDSELQEMAYVVYMIVGSYFNKAKCRNQKMADNLFLYYAEMKPETQEAKEGKMISQTETILEAYKTVLAKMNCEVEIHITDHKYVLDFITGFEQIHVEVKKNEKNKAVCEMQILSD